MNIENMNSKRLKCKFSYFNVINDSKPFIDPKTEKLEFYFTIYIL